MEQKLRFGAFPTASLCIFEICRRTASGCCSTYNVHHPCFLVDETVLPIGTALLAELALQSLDDLSAPGAWIDSDPVLEP